MNDGMDECGMSGLPKAWCAHCRKSEQIDLEEEFEVLSRSFEAQFPGRCTLDYDHVIKRGDLIARVRHADNPMQPVQGVACSKCVKMLPRAER